MAVVMSTGKLGPNEKFQIVGELINMICMPRTALVPWQKQGE
jgi:hypothetical protein